MSNERIALLTIAVVAIGIFALPSTMSLFAGQHAWYDLSGGYRIYTDVPCEKCHADVAAEMDSQIGPHTGETGFGRMECEYCHRVRWGSYQYGTVSGSEIKPGKQAHAASTIACMDCHGCISSGEFNAVVGSDHGAAVNNLLFELYADCAKCHGGSTTDKSPDIPPAGGFGLTNASGDTGSMAAHKIFVLDAINDSTLEDANEACVTCHTHAAVKINWTHARSLEFDIGIGDPLTTETGVHNWTVSEWSVNGTANVTVWGNTTGAGNTSYWSEWPGNVDSIYE